MLKPKLMILEWQHTISVGEVTRLVKIMPGKLTIVKFEVERKGMPWLVVFSIMVTGLGLSFLVMVMSICRLVRKIIFKHLKMYFCTGDAVKLGLKAPRLAFKNLLIKVKSSLTLMRRTLSLTSKRLLRIILLLIIMTIFQNPCQARPAPLNSSIP